MTGFGKATGEQNGKKVTVEIRSLNSKQLDLSLRMPSVYREKELELRTFISKQLERGKVDVSIHTESSEEKSEAVINTKLAITYYNQLKDLSATLGEAQDNLLPLVLKMPDVMKGEKVDMDETEWALIVGVVNEAIANFLKFRNDEGRILQEEFSKRINLIANHLQVVEGLDELRVKKIKERITNSLSEVIEKERIDENRFEQELIYYVEKIDITEEKLRLKTHCDYFLKTMTEEDNAGRKLGFITQEIGREINTIGSKANNADIQKSVVQMKDELEKIKEQLLNVL